MGIKVKYSFDVSDMLNTLDHANQAALAEVAHQVLLDTNEFVPYSGKQVGTAENGEPMGRLRKSAKLEQSDKTKWNVSYSRRIYYTDSDGNTRWVEGASDLYNRINPVTQQPIKNWTTPGTGSRWFYRAMEANMDDWHKKFTRSWKKQFVGKSSSAPKSFKL